MLRSAGLKQRTLDSSALSENLHFCVRGLPLRGEPMKGIVGNRLTELDNEADRATTSSFIPDVPIHSPSSSTTIIFFSLLFLFLLSLSLSATPLFPPPLSSRFSLRHLLLLPFSRISFSPKSRINLFARAGKMRFRVATLFCCH